MKAVLVRIAVDHSYGNWNGPVDERGNFVYVPIPEKAGTVFHDGLERPYHEIVPALERFKTQLDPRMYQSSTLPHALHDRSMHLDPDFEHMTYGDVGNRRGKDIATMSKGDLIAFYSGLRPTYSCEHKLLYALVGLYMVDEVLAISNVLQDRFKENAHTRKIKRGESDIVVRAQPDKSGRLERCIPIGEFRDRAYRVRKDILEEWGGLSVNDGYVQRSAVPPKFTNPNRFYEWFKRQDIALINKNN